VKIGSATPSEVSYIREVLTHFRRIVPDATRSQQAQVAKNTLRRLRVWAVIAHFREVNYGRQWDVLEAEFIE